MAVNIACREDETEWGPSHQTTTAQDQKKAKSHHKMCCESSKEPHCLSGMGNIKHTQREERVSVGEWGALVGEMTYPSLSALVDGAGAGTVTVPTLSSLI